MYKELRFEMFCYETSFLVCQRHLQITFEGGGLLGVGGVDGRIVSTWLRRGLHPIVVPVHFPVHLGLFQWSKHWRPPTLFRFGLMEGWRWGWRARLVRDSVSQSESLLTSYSCPNLSHRLESSSNSVPLRCKSLPLRWIQTGMHVAEVFFYFRYLFCFCVWRNRSLEGEERVTVVFSILSDVGSLWHLTGNWLVLQREINCNGAAR